MKKIIAIILAGLLMFGLTACGNRDWVDLNYTYDKAIIQLANGEVVTIDIRKWSDYDGEQIQIIAEDGTVYLTSSLRCDLIKYD